MKAIIRLSALFAAASTLFAGSASANDFPTTDRVEYVMECVARNQGKHEYIYKCSCALDEIAKSMKYDDYLSASSIARYQSMPGERAGVFRDPENIKDEAKKYRAIQADANKRCGVPG